MFSGVTVPRRKVQKPRICDICICLCDFAQIACAGTQQATLYVDALRPTFEGKGDTSCHYVLLPRHATHSPQWKAQAFICTVPLGFRTQASWTHFYYLMISETNAPRIFCAGSHGIPIAALKPLPTYCQELWNTATVWATKAHWVRATSNG